MSYAAKKPRVPWLATRDGKQIEVAQDSERGIFIVDPRKQGWLAGPGGSVQKELYEVERGRYVYESEIFVSWLDRPKDDKVALDAVAKYAVAVEQQRLSRYCTPLTPETDPYSSAYDPDPAGARVMASAAMEPGYFEPETCDACAGTGQELSPYGVGLGMTCSYCGGEGTLRR